MSGNRERQHINFDCHGKLIKKIGVCMDCPSVDACIDLYVENKIENYAKRKLERILIRELLGLEVIER